MIELEQVSFCYPGNNEETLLGVTGKVPSGSATALLGPNGAGKTTLVALITGQLPLQKGQIAINGLDVQKHRRDIQTFTSLVPQDYAFYSRLTGLENLQFFAGIHGLKGSVKKQKIDEAIAFCGLDQAIGRMAANYSGGLKRRLNLAIGLLNSPSLLILDEPTVGIDPQSRHYIVERLNDLRSEGVTLLYTSHMLDEVQRLCEHLIMIDQGQVIVEDSMANTLAKQSAQQRIQVVIKPDKNKPLSELIETLIPTSFSEGELNQTVELEWLCDREKALLQLESTLSQLLQWGLSVESVSLGSQRLEDVFLSLTSNQLRD